MPKRTGLSLSSNNHITSDALFGTSGYIPSESVCVGAPPRTCVCGEIKQPDPKGMEHLSFILLPSALLCNIKGQCTAPLVRDGKNLGEKKVNTDEEIKKEDRGDLGENVTSI